MVGKVEFAELKQEFRDYKEKQCEANVDIKARLASIDASISALAPIINEHKERFVVLGMTSEANAKQNNKNEKRIDRLEMSFVGSLVTVVMLALGSAWSVLFPPKV